ncbi:MAG: TlpA family protein disulfide reductase [Candidatus Krumholzibacteria bacterium]|nr:TlpA family protein disulfide reductase [Candidatus Krumholzibacteria bacterium]
MVELKKREEELGIKLLSIEVSGNLKMTRDMVKEKGLNFPVLIDARSYSRESLRITGTPTTFIIDPDGKIRCRLIGYLPDMQKTVEDAIERI